MRLPTDRGIRGLSGERRALAGDGIHRFELILIALFLACWVVVALDLVELVPIAGRLDLGLYPLYAIAALLGSVAGHTFVFRARRADRALRRRLLLVYFAGPPALLVLLRSLASEEVQSAAPLVPLWAVLVFAIFTIVPLTMRRPLPPGNRR